MHSLSHRELFEKKRVVERELVKVVVMTRRPDIGEDVGPISASSLNAGVNPSWTPSSRDASVNRNVVRLALAIAEHTHEDPWIGRREAAARP